MFIKSVSGYVNSSHIKSLEVIARTWERKYGVVAFLMNGGGTMQEDITSVTLAICDTEEQANSTMMNMVLNLNG